MQLASLGQLATDLVFVLNSLVLAGNQTSLEVRGSSSAVKRVGHQSILPEDMSNTPWSTLLNPS